MTTTTNETRYNVQCIIHGYCGTVGPNESRAEYRELYEDAMRREADGFLDAICLGPQDKSGFCQQCEDERYQRVEADIYFDECERMGLFD